MPSLIAIKPMRYLTRRLLPGDEFEATARYAKVFTATRLARRVGEDGKPAGEKKKRGRKSAEKPADDK